jgi:predicted dehydrogenase
MRVVVLGNSYASYCQIPAMRWAGGADIVALCGKNLDKAKATAEKFSIPLATTSLDEALATNPELVLVSTPVDLHASMVERVLSTTNAMVLCEKPFTLGLDDARRLASLAGARGFIDHQLRFSAPRRRFRELARTLGTPWVARSEMCFGSPERLQRPASWWDDAARGGGAMQAIASHLVDGLLWILGPVVDVQARLTSCVKQRGDVAVTADDHCELWLTHASGARSTVVCTTVQTHGRRSLLEVIGSEGVVRLVDEDELTIAKHGGAVERVDVKLPGVAEVNAANDSAFARCEPLLMRALLRGETSELATFDGAVACVEVLSAAERFR